MRSMCSMRNGFISRSQGPLQKVCHGPARMSGHSCLPGPQTVCIPRGRLHEQNEEIPQMDGSAGRTHTTRTAQQPCCRELLQSFWTIRVFCHEAAPLCCMLLQEVIHQCHAWSCFCEMLALMYLQQGPQIVENETTPHRTHRMHRMHRARISKLGGATFLQLHVPPTARCHCFGSLSVAN
jgi:hypothetical protein